MVAEGATDVPAQAETASDFNDLKEALKFVVKQIAHMQEPINQLAILADALKLAVSSDRCASDSEFATFLCEDLSPGLAMALQKERSNDQNVSGALSC